MKKYYSNLSGHAAKIFRLFFCLAVVAASSITVNAQKGNENKVTSQAPEAVSVDDSSGEQQLTDQPASQPEHSRRRFTNASLNDLYGFHALALGGLNPANPTTGASIPFAISGYYRFNGDGTLSGQDTVSRGGLIFERVYDGTYQVNRNGTGTLKLFISETFQPEGRFVITQSGKQIEIIFAVPGNLNAFTLHKQNVQ